MHRLFFECANLHGFLDDRGILACAHARTKMQNPRPVSRTEVLQAHGRVSARVAQTVAGEVIAAWAAPVPRSGCRADHGATCCANCATDQSTPSTACDCTNRCSRTTADQRTARSAFTGSLASGDGKRQCCGCSQSQNLLHGSIPDRSRADSLLWAVLLLTRSREG